MAMKRWMHLFPAIFLCGQISLLFGDALIVTRAMKATTIAEIFIEDEEVRVELEIGGSDLRAFGRVLPDEIHRAYSARAAAAGQSLQEYLLALLVETARHRTPAEIVEQVEQRLTIEGSAGFASVSAAELVRTDRDAH